MHCVGLQAAAQIDLSGASIGGQLNLDGAHLDGKDRQALAALGLTVTAHILGRRFWAAGQVDLSGASIGGWLDLCGAHLDGQDGPA